MVSVVSDNEVFVMFITLDGEDPAWKTFRKAQNSINYECWEKGNKRILKKFQ
jgi:hypothetical protein